MVSGVSPPGGGYPTTPTPPPNPPNNDAQIIGQMQEYEAELRDAMGPPPQTARLQQLLVQMRDFMTKNQGAISDIMEKQGYPLTGPFSISSEFDTSISQIKIYLENINKKPPPHGALDLLNESVTQINFYFTHHNDTP